MYRFPTATMLLAAALLLPADLRAAEAVPAAKPNIVFILIDDLGWADVGCYGSSLYETPHIDALATSGMKFTNGYAACPVCSPTRASIMTGKYPARLKLTNFLVGLRTRPGSPILPADYVHHLPLEEITLAEQLSQAGYTCGHVGKWHLGGQQYLPENQGFAFNFGGTHHGMPRAFFYPQWKGNPPVVGEPGQYLPDLICDQAVKFIRENREQPFFLYLAHYAVHIPIQGKPDVVEKYRRKVDPQATQTNPHYAAMVESIDDSVGRVLRTLDELKLSDNTIVIFFSDNGGLSVPEGPHTPATNNAPLRAGKGLLYEGGIREPLIVRSPGLTKAGSVCDVPVTSVDFFPTLSELAAPKQELPENIDGVSLVPLLRGETSLARDAIYWHYPHFSNQGSRPGGAIRRGDWKLIERYEDGSLELFNLADDLSEKHNLATQLPAKAAELKQELVAWREAVDANMPKPNPKFKP